MIIGIDVSAIPFGTGVSNYTENLVRNLVHLDKQNVYKLFYSSLRLPLPASIASLRHLSHVKIYHYHLPPTLLYFLWNRLHVLPIEIFIGRCDLFHTWNWLQPPSLWTKTITTVHDLSPFALPQYHHPQTISAEKTKMYWATRECRHFICVSQTTRSELLKYFPQILPANTSVVYEAAEKKYSQFHHFSPAVQKIKITKFKQQYGLDRYILAQGTQEPRKNLHRLIKAFVNFQRLYPQSNLELAISGKYGWGNKLTPIPGVKILGYIPEKDLVLLHASAFCLAYVALYEGFGLPVLKSLSVGTPVITSAHTSMAEFSGNSVLTVNPRSPISITSALIQLYQSSSLRRTLVRRGLKIAQNFNWSKTAKQTLSIYQKFNPSP